MSLFDYVKENYSCYKECLGYYYQTDLASHPEILDEINDCDFVFVESDYAEPIEGCFATQFMTSAECPYTAMWLRQDYSSYLQLPHSEWTDVPTVGFVGRVPVFTIPRGDADCAPDGCKSDVPIQALHKGFMERAMALQLLGESTEVCSDFHVRYKPEGDSCGFWNDTLPGFKKSGPLFKTNMLANQYQVCARGNANWSLRFFETMAYGRIPVYVESGGMTPADWWYGKLQDRLDDFPGVYVKDVNDIEWEILKYHNSIDSLAEMQDLCRAWYIDNYSTVAQVAAFDAMFKELRND